MRLKQKRHVWQQMGWILPALVLSAATGCIPPEVFTRSIRPEAVKSIVIGKTTQSDIKQLFGTPYRTGVESGEVTWTYVNQRIHLTVTDLLVRFNSDGTVKSYKYNE